MTHDPGGKIKLALPDGMWGSAVFSECGRYLHLLTRGWRAPPESIGVVWIGMNPSTADEDFDDPTVRREAGFTKRLGFTSFAKVNVMDYRATDPKRLLSASVVPCSDKNMRTILRICGGAGIVVAAWSALPKGLRRYARQVEDALWREGYVLSCLGCTKDGSPRHPLYLRKDTELLRYRRR